MSIDKEKLKGLLWSVKASLRSNGNDLQRHTEALDEFLGEKTIEEVALGLLEETERQAAQFKEWQASHHANYVKAAEERDQLTAENTALRLQCGGMEMDIQELKVGNDGLRKAALEAREFIMHEAEVRGLLDESNEVSFRHPRRQAAIAVIDAALSNEVQP